MGVVYAAHDDRLDRPVAIKVVRPEAVSDERARERFRREARVAARVSHPNICPLYEFDEAGGHPFLVMELLEGEPLSVRLARGAMPLDEALTLAQTMLDALAALHRRGIMHRDLKPANVFLTPHGLKLLDFGVAQPITGEDDTRERELTGPNVLIGTRSTWRRNSCSRDGWTSAWTSSPLAPSSTRCSPGIRHSTEPHCRSSSTPSATKTRRRSTGSRSLPPSMKCSGRHWRSARMTVPRGQTCWRRCCASGRHAACGHAAAGAGHPLRRPAAARAQTGPGNRLPVVQRP